MGQEPIHEMTAAYALNALDETERREYEQHLAGCRSCREELPALVEAANSLAYATPAPEPPRELRARILEQARLERSTVVPLRSRRLVRGALTTGALAAAAAVALAIWASSLRSSLDDTRSALERREQVVAVLSDPESRQVVLAGADGRLVVAPSGRATLVASLPRPPEGRTYQAWVQTGGTARSAGVFEPSEGRAIFRLEQPVLRGSTVMVTLEADGGVPAPTGQFLVRARA